VVSKIALHALTLILLVGPAGVAASGIAWPPLEDVGHVKGRAATEADVAKGVAAFALKSEGKPAGKPIRMRIPQYAFHVDEQTGKKTPVVLIQAEEGQGMRIAGYVDVRSGKKEVGLLSELRLLGATPPR
jgi:hypothetical protein